MGYSSDIVLQCENISRSFGRLEVLKKVNLKVRAGERRAILGPNGAGKTTLFNIICGELPPSSGQVLIHVEDVTHRPSFTRIRQGFSRTFQVTNLFYDMSALENVIMALYGCRQRKLTYWKPVSRSKEFFTQGLELLEQFSLSHLQHEIVKNISYGDQRLLEIVLALCSKPSILALDEPSSGLSSAERQKLTTFLKALDPSLTLIFIEHDMDLVTEVSKFVSVLHHGTMMAEGTVQDMKNDSRVRDVYMGGDDSVKY